MSGYEFSYGHSDLADRPAAAAWIGWWLVDDEDDGTLYKSDGATWVQQAPGVSATGGGPVAAEDVTVDSTTLVGTGTDAQAVFEEVDNAIVAAEGATAAHLADATDAHPGTAIGNTPAGGVAATTVQAAINELDTEKAAASHAHSGADITSGTVVDARIDAAIARDSEVTAAIAALSSVYQAKDTSLDYFAGLDPAANVKTILEAANYAAIRTALGVAASGLTRRVRVRLDTPDTSGNGYPALSTANGFSNVRRVVPAFTKDVIGTWEGSVQIPQDYASGGAIVCSYVANATSGVYRSQVSTAVVAAAVSEDAAYTDETAVDTTVPGTAKQRFDVSVTLTTTPAAGSTLNVKVTHAGTHTNDTLAVDALLWECHFSYVSV